MNLKDMARHAFIGNDTPPWIVAGARGFLGALISGSLGFLVTWQGTDEVKVLVSAGVTPFLTYLGIRLGIEGFIDARKNGS